MCERAGLDVGVMWCLPRHAVSALLLNCPLERCSTLPLTATLTLHLLQISP
jgi:hypothetical protein